MPRRVLCTCLLTCCLLCAVRTARAQESPGAFRLGLDGALFAFESETHTLEMAGSGDEETDVGHSRFGLLAPRLGLRLGLLLANLVVIGARLGFSSESSETEGVGDQSDFRWRAAPAAHVLFPALGPLRPTLGAYVGAEGREMEVLGVDGDQLAARSGMSLIYGGSVGVHLFASDRVSIDASISVGGSTGSHDISTGSGKSSVDVSTFEVVGLLGINAWLGDASDDGREDGAFGSSAMPEPARPPLAPGETNTRLGLDGAVVDLWIDAAADPGVVSVRVARVGEQPVFGGCEQIHLLVDGDMLGIDVEHDSRPVERLVEEELYGRTDLASLRRLADATTRQITACAMPLDLDESASFMLDTFLDEAEAQQPPPVVPRDPAETDAAWAPPGDEEPPVE